MIRNFQFWSRIPAESNFSIRFDNFDFDRFCASGPSLAPPVAGQKTVTKNRDWRQKTMTSAAVAFPHLPRACPHARFWHFWHPAEKTVTPCVTQSLALAITLALSLFLAITHGRNPGRNLWPPPKRSRPGRGRRCRGGWGRARP